MLKNSENPQICEGLVADHMNFMFKLAVEKIQMIRDEMKKHVP